MKRLLAYLFIVLGLGLTFSVNTKADNYCIPKKAENHFNSIYIWEECYVYHKKVDLNTFVEFALTNALNSVGVRKESPLFAEENLKWLKKYLRENNISKSKINKSIKRVKIAKKEPGKTQKINIENCREVNALSGKVRFLENNEAPILYKNINIDFLNKRIEFEKNKNWVKDNSKSKKIYETRFKFGPNDNIILSNVVGMHLGTSVLIEIDYKSGVIKQGQNQQMKLICEKINNTKTQFAKLFDGKSLNIEKTVITKTEPSQTQKMAKKKELNDLDKIADLISKAKNPEPGAYSFGDSDHIVSRIIANKISTCWSIPLGIPASEKDLIVRVKLLLNYDGSIRKTEILNHSRMNTPGQGFYRVLAESVLRAIKLCAPYKVNTNKSEEILIKVDARNILFGTPSIEDSKSEIAKAKSTIKPKKKVKVAKVEDSTQEEFKPETGDIDNDAPVIEIAEAITVDSQAYTLKGKVKDKSRFQLTIDDRPIKVDKNGQFEFEGFAIDSKEQLKIVAIDRWKNKSEKKVNVEVKIKQVADLRPYEKPNPSKIKVKKDNNKIGIIIGIEKYQNLNNIDAPYANRDAKAFKAYANIALGIPNNNLKVLIDEDATRGELLKSLKIWLPQITRGKEKDIYIFFAGHGLASDNGEDLHILPHNGDPILLEDTALSRVEMFDLINKVSPKSVTMFFDTCYSGQTRSEQMLVAGLRPVRIVANEQDTPNNFTIFTASNYDQTSGSINEAEHGIFSYYLMKGLEGKADENSDKKITNGELISYLKNNVTQEAFYQNRSQEPMLSGDPDTVLISYR
jgi:hypothetical protein